MTNEVNFVLQEEEIVGGTNGWYNGAKVFECGPQKGVVVPITHVKLDKRFQADGKSDDDSQNFGDINYPPVQGNVAPVKVKDIREIIGKNNGIQGHQNSCYLDATLFAMFAFTCVFDSLIYRRPNKTDIAEYTEVQQILKEEIVNPLRKYMFVRADKVMKLRKLLDHLTSVRGLTSEEKGRQ